MYIVDQISREEKDLAMVANLSAFGTAIIPLANLLIPLIIWQSKKGESDYVADQAKEALNFQLSLYLYALLLIVLFISIIGIIIAVPGIITLVILSMVQPVIGAIRASEGVYYRYSVSTRFIK